jgi:hypothetical protein
MSGNEDQTSAVNGHVARCAGQAPVAARCSSTGGQPFSYGIFSPASIAAGSRFSGGGNGQVARSV